MRLLRTAALFAVIVAAHAAPAHAAGPSSPPIGPDIPGGGPIAIGKAATSAAIDAATLRELLARALRRAHGRSGAWVRDLTEGTTLFKRAAKLPLVLASNTKLYTTAAALSRIGPSATVVTELWSVGEIKDGSLDGYLVLRGAGDPGLDANGLRSLADALVAAGVSKVRAPLRYDDSVFDRRVSVPQEGISGGPYLGNLSGLSFDQGAAPRPARRAARAMIEILRKRGVAIPRKVKRGELDPKLAVLLAGSASPPLAVLAAQTNVISNNFYAEMLLKLIGSEVKGQGTTQAGAEVVRKFAARRGAEVAMVNGSGLSRLDVASARSVGRLLAAMIGAPGPIGDAFTGSLPVAGRTGTLAKRMRGTAAEGRCRAKTGTLTDVSALSGYCFVGDRVIAFSILNNNVNVFAAQAAQDRMVALIARFRG